MGLAAGKPAGNPEFVAGALVGGVAAVVWLGAGETTAPGDAGLKPRLLGLFSIVPARLLTILASFIATSRSAASRMSFRCFIRA